ncbi:tubulin-tyrosine ligase, putative [Bodo saltans]|uniref:Tubulin-tyrosine ligase, putative n=1 Tax=Bodo saltans TaxID=75058 RepID=A0A0S4IUG9_BODSA|nr:tubulin-tyrosine ligase, putative [Bodo saltans]|eukprot:CUF92558.1 tubulin-tyrosine ligase, putative [Bodo saltans]
MNNVVSPLEALRQPPIIRSPQAVVPPSASARHGLRPQDSDDGSDSDDDDIAIMFPSVELQPATSAHSHPPFTAAPPQQQRGLSIEISSNHHGSGSTKDASGSSSFQTTAATNSTTPLSSTLRSTRKKKKNGKKVLHVCLTKYPVIRELADEMSFIVDNVDEELEKFDFNMIWSDTVLPLQKLVRLANWQRSNHFPSMHLLCRKVHLGLTLGRMRKVFPAHYNFFPRTWSMRSEKQQFARFYAQQPVKKVFILKPNAGCQGKGIVLSKDPLNAVDDLDNYVCQEYVTRPLLIENKKFDLRVYCLVTSIRHLSIFVYNDGLVRMCADAYEKPNDENMGNACQHLTNYAVNKHSDNFVFNSDKQGRGDLGNKRDFVWLNRWLRDQGQSPEKFWERVHHMIIKTIIAAQPQMTHVYNSCFPHSNDGYTCFEVLGFDILVDDRVKPILMEVNHTPSFSCDTPLDHRIKHDCLMETWKIIDVQAGDKQRHQEREKAMFARRMQSTRTASSMVPMDSMLSTAQVQSQENQLLAQGELSSDPRFAAEQLAAEHRRKEDQKVKNYKRVYPSTNIERQALYETILAAAKTASAIPTTASQEQRQLEVKAEREKREQKRNGGTDSSRRPVQRPTGSAHGGAGGIAPQPPSLPASGNVTPTSVNDDILAAPHPFQRANLLLGGGGSNAQPAGPPAVAAGGGARGGAIRSSSHRSSIGASTDRPKRTKEDVERQRQKLADQMERHRRRMVLGPRLSVFQLREVQLSAMFQDDELIDEAELQQQQQQQQQQPTSHPRSHTTGRLPATTSNNGNPSNGGGTGGSRSRDGAGLTKDGLPSSAPGSSGSGGSGLSLIPQANAMYPSTSISHHEQFQAILQQLSRYQHSAPEYRFYDSLRGEAPPAEASGDHRLSVSERALAHHEGLDLGDIEEDDDFGAGGGMYYEEEEEEEE